MTSRPKQPKYARNKNILVIGGSGSGKTRFFVKPSIMQMHSSYVITDPKGQLLKETGKMLLHGAPKLDENGKPVRDDRGRIIYEPYRIKVLNTINFSKSMKYNPLAYVRSEKDILKLVNVIIANTKGDGEKSSEDFWVKAERLLYCALIGYIWYEAEPEERNFITLLELGRATWYFVDEFHLLLKEEQTAAYSAEIWKRFRKWGGVPTGATQNPKDLLHSPEIENILENSDFIYLLNLSAGDRKLMTERLNISAEQLAYVTNADPGSGLLFFQNVILPFKDEFPKTTELYRLLTTKPSEVSHDGQTG